MMEKSLQEIRERVLAELSEAKASSKLEQIRVGVLGKKGELTGLLRGMGKLPAEERPRVGQLVNEVRAALEEALDKRAAELKEREKEERLAAEAIDVTLPGPERSAGSLHPMNIALNKMIDIFVGMGYEVVEGPEVEYDHYNFELLNLPKNHPARDAQDTFYVDDNIVLRTHTSPVQARIMTTRKPPIRIICPGRVYRADEADATHSPVFHQMEGLVIDENITMGDLKGTLDEFARQMYGEGIRTRFRPSFFPFTEPHSSIFTSIHARSSASRQPSGLTPFSNLPEASVRTPSLRAVMRLFARSNAADSNSTLAVSPTISDSSPPMMPASPVAFSASAITSIDSSST